MSGEEVTNDEWRIGDERRAIEDDEQESRASEPDQERAGLRSYRPKEGGDKISKTVKTRGFVSLCYRSHPSEVSEGQCDGKGARPCTTTRYSTVTEENLRQCMDGMLTEVGCDPDDIPVTTDKGANIVAATSQKQQLTCICQRLNKAQEKAWDNATSTQNNPLVCVNISSGRN